MMTDVPDIVVKTGSFVTNPEGRPAGIYLKYVLANAHKDEIYINLNDLIWGDTAEDVCNPNTKCWWERKPYVDVPHNAKHNDVFATLYYGKWAYDQIAFANILCDDDAEISDADFMSVLNGGGFNAVA